MLAAAQARGWRIDEAMQSFERSKVARRFEDYATRDEFYRLCDGLIE